MTQTSERIAGSFRDPAGYVAEFHGRIFRVVRADDAARALSVLEAPAVVELMASGSLIGTRRCEDAEIRAELGLADGQLLLEHDRIQFVSFAYEWPFAALKAAALAHLDLHIRLLDNGLTLNDSTVFNVQFRGPRPVFIDFLSIHPYREGEFWSGQRQFVEQFLAPLILSADRGIAAQQWLRSSPEGIPMEDFVSLLGLGRRLTPTVLMQVVLPSSMQKRLRGKDVRNVKPRALPKSSYVALLKQMRGLVESISPKVKASTWSDYEVANNYDQHDENLKRHLVSGFASRVKPGTLIDLGCNGGAYSRIALQNGAGLAVGVDADWQALGAAYGRAVEQQLDLLPLYQDLANPSPSQGWMGTERPAFFSRARFDGVMALALIHHLIIGRNLPVDDVARFITGAGRAGIIEFVSKSDVQVQRLLAHREDIFPGYTEEGGLAAIGRYARVVGVERLGSGNRSLISFEGAA